MSVESVSSRLAVAVPEPVLQRLRVRYGEPHRHYHDWHHVLACLDARDRLVERSSAAIDLALLFHDAVYVPLARDNEARSAALLREECSHLPSSVLDQATAAILATAGHRSAAGDVAVVCDADLAILGADPAAFAAYERGVRAELGMIDEAAFCAGRARFLRQMAQRPLLYATERGRALWETKARRNLAASLASLEA